MCGTIGVGHILRVGTQNKLGLRLLSRHDASLRRTSGKTSGRTRRLDLAPLLPSASKPRRTTRYATTTHGDNVQVGRPPPRFATLT